MTVAEEREAGRQRVLEARDPATPPSRLTELASDALRPVRVFAARNPSTPPNALGLLALDSDMNVRWCALVNQHLPAEGLEALAQMEHARVGAQSFLLSYILHHPNAPESLREQLMGLGVCSCGSGRVCVPEHWLRPRGWGTRR